MTISKSEVRCGMRIDWDVPITMDDSNILRADIFRPMNDGRYPVILTHGPYAKNLHFEDGYPNAWKLMCQDHPDVPRGSTNAFQSWEVVDPEKWVPDGFVCVRVDSRGAGRSAGFMDNFSQRETQDYYECIEWAGVQEWSNGKVGLNGISYYAINQYLVAGLNPPHLAAICTWEGAADFYRDGSYHGGVPSSFWGNWYDMQVKVVQHGLGTNGPTSRMNGELVCGPETLTPEELDKNRLDLKQAIHENPLCNTFFQQRSADWSKIKVPLFSAASWAGQGLHPRGNYEAFMNAASKEKWLEIHGLEHWTHFYTDYGVQLQKKFFNYFLKGEINGWDKQPPVQMQARYPNETFGLRYENEWPLQRTQWTHYWLDAKELSLNTDHAPKQESHQTYVPANQGITFKTQPLKKQTELLGPIAAKLFVSSKTKDADLFLIVRVFDCVGKELVYQGTVDPHTPISQGWLRVSHRKLDPQKTLPYRPYHSHDEVQYVKENEIVEVDVEIWPTGLIIPPGYQIALTIQGRDYEWEGVGVRYSNFKNELKGCGPFLHDDPLDRPPDIYNGEVTVHTGGKYASYLMLPIIPS